MPRARSCRRVIFFPPSLVFRPASLNAASGEIVIGLDGLEALRLAHVVGLEHVDAARRMEVSRATFSRILKHASSSVARALVEGRALRFDDTPTCPTPCSCRADRGGARAPRKARIARTPKKPT